MISLLIIACRTALLGIIATDYEVSTGGFPKVSIRYRLNAYLMLTVGVSSDNANDVIASVTANSQCKWSYINAIEEEKLNELRRKINKIDK